MNLQPFFSSFWLTCAVSVISAQPVWAQVTQVTGVRIEAKDGGLEVILATTEGRSPQVLRTSSSKTVAFDIPNTQLRLPDGKDFRANNPGGGIESITVAQQNANSVRVTVVGISALPAAKVVPSRTGLVLSLSVPDETPSPVTPAPAKPATEPEATPKVPEEEETEIIVTGEREEESYQVPSASTGTRTDTPIRDIPQSIQVVPQQVLEDQRVIRLGDALRNVSGITPSDISTRGSATGATIRGFETDNILRNGLRDDTTRRISETTNIEQIEILKGPASVIFGQGNLGGTINIITKQPLAEPFYSAEFTAGSYSLYRPSLDLTGPLDTNRSLLYRLNASYENSRSFIDFEHSDRVFIAPVLRWNIGENTTLTVEAEHLHEWADGFAPQLPASGTVVENPNGGDIPISANLGEPSLTESDRRVTRIGYRFEHRFNDDWLIRNDFAAAFGRTPENTGIQLQGPPLQGPRADDPFAGRILVENPSEEDILSLNTNLVGNFTTGDIDHKLLLGLELAREDIKDRINYGFPDPIDIFNPIYVPESLTPPSPQQDTRTLTESIGIYIQDQIYFSDNLILVLGGRFDIADQTFEEFVQAPLTDFSRKDEVFNPRLGIVYKPIEPVSLYASYSRSFNPLSGLTAARVPLEPESGTQYEVGVKTDFFDERLSATLAFYNLERTNVAVEDATNPGFQLQVGEQRSQGIELDVTGEILPGWNIIASYAYTTTEITEGITTESTEDEESIVGNQLNNIPKHAASLWTTYELQDGALQGLGFGLGVYFVGKREGNLENTFRLPQYWRTDAALYYRRNNFRAQLNFQNLFDIRYFESARSEFRVNPGAPFTVLGTLGWEF